MRKLKEWLVAGGVLLVALLAPRRRERLVARQEPSARAERAAILLFLAAAACAVAFPVLYGLDPGGNLTQTLGASLGLALLFAGAAFIVVGKRVAPQEENEEEYPPPEQPEEQEHLVQLVSESGEAVSRKRLLTLAGTAAGGALGIAFLTPAVSLGPVFETAPFFGTPWRRGRRLVDENDRPYRASDIERDNFYTAFPEGADKELIGSSIVLVRLPEADLDLPPGRSSWAPGGILAYSKICTHAGCAISLYRAPLFQPDEPKPALVCPCHYSTFDPARGAKVIFGPAGRPLPQLPLSIDSSGHLRAAGNFSGAVGPSWWGIRNRKPRP